VEKLQVLFEDPSFNKGQKGLNSLTSPEETSGGYSKWFKGPICKKDFHITNSRHVPGKKHITIALPWTGKTVIIEKKRFKMWGFLQEESAQKRKKNGS